MSIRYKLFIILGLSQILLLFALTFSFVFLLTSVKNEPQNKRAKDQAKAFQKELKHKEEKLSIYKTKILENPKTLNLLKQGLQNRNILASDLETFTKLMKEYNLNIFEIGNSSGFVVFRFHRPNDYGDNKSSQPVIRKALKGETASSLEVGHSGLGFRVAGPIPGGGTILLGQVVDNAFTASIVPDPLTHIAIFEKNRMLSWSDTIIEEFANKGSLPKERETRVEFKDKPYYLTHIVLDDANLSTTSLDFLVLIDETELRSKEKNIWWVFAGVVVIVFAGIFTISFVFSSDIIDAIRKLNRAMQELEKDDSVLTLRRKDEIGQMGKVFSQMKVDLLRHQNHLEEMVREKTRELNQTLEDLRKIKDKQDGDYYLTSLLIRPLSGGKVEHKNLDVVYLQKQKKSFLFKGKEIEIGGDLCVIETIQLSGREYTVILNADAMGKSIQGAGGAIVVGTVFKNIISRTADISFLRDSHPENWLLECYKELHNVFLSFDGHMLTSAVISLFDNQTGTLYYVNAEHPWIVLYRDSKASFLEHELMLRKLGFSFGGESQFSIKVFQLRPKDKIIFGSDGRDDILLSTSDGNKVINEDEKEFLKSVEEGEGELEKILESILKKGELTDDLSLIKLEFKEYAYETKAIKKELSELKKKAKEHLKERKFTKAKTVLLEMFKMDPEHMFTIRELAKINILEGDLQRAIQFAEKYFLNRPDDTDFLYYLAITYKKAKEFARSQEFVDRLALREPNSLRIFVIQIELKLHEKNYRDAMMILQDAEEKYPENSKLRKLSKFINGKLEITS